MSLTDNQKSVVTAFGKIKEKEENKLMAELAAMYLTQTGYDPATEHKIYLDPNQKSGEYIHKSWRAVLDLMRPDERLANVSHARIKSAILKQIRIRRGKYFTAERKKLNQQ